MKINRIHTLFIAIFLTTGLHQANAHKGVGCWRTQPLRHFNAARGLASPHRVNIGERTNYHGEKKGLVILAEFTDKEFRLANDRDKYDQILNENGYTTDEGFRGSVADYFRDQSNGVFELRFDVVGPYTAANNIKYYGENDDEGNDKRPGELIREMCIAADDDVNFADYDWDGDGEVDEVFVVYAGKNEAVTSQANLLWPHMWSIREATGSKLKLDGVIIDVYACSSELNSSGRIDGIGTFCHEFSHCLGLPDFYDINYDGLFGMSNFDLMCSGNYNGNGYCPAGYTAYEKMMCGWQEPIELSDADTIITNMESMSNHGETYIIYNDANPNEYYLIENRQKTGWDDTYPASGLMITHVDFDEEVWRNNIVNTVLTLSEAREMGLTVGNDHQRMTIFHADNDDDSKYWSASGYYKKKTTSTDLYPYLNSDSLTATSKPAATLFNKNSQGQKLMRGAILNITQNEDGSMSFNYRSGKSQEPTPIKSLQTTAVKPTIYTLDGRVVKKADATSLRHGIYIVNGKKVIY